MSNILQTLLATYQQNPAAALSLLPDLFQAVEDGRVIELPCRPGGTVFIRRYNLSQKKNIIVEARCAAVKVFSVGFKIDSIPSAGMICKGEWGRQVFATREAAEQALKERGKNGRN